MESTPVKKLKIEKNYSLNSTPPSFDSKYYLIDYIYIDWHRFALDCEFFRKKLIEHLDKDDFFNFILRSKSLIARQIEINDLCQNCLTNKKSRRPRNTTFWLSLSRASFLKYSFNLNVDFCEKCCKYFDSKNVVFKAKRKKLVYKSKN